MIHQAAEPHASAPPAVLVAEGDLTRMACSGWLLPSDRNGYVTDTWVSQVPGLSSLVDRAELGAPGEWQLQEQFVPGPDGAGPRLPLGADRPAVVPVDAGDDFGDGAPHFVRALRAGVGRMVGSDPSGVATLRRAVPLVAFPLLGGAAGGGGAIRGEVVGALVKEANALAVANSADLCLVTRSPQARAAAFSWRSNLALQPVLSDGLTSVVGRLAELALRGRLVAFLGAGVGAAAGAPNWAGLLTELARGLGWDDERVKRLAALDSLDQAELIRRELEATRGSLGEAVRELVTTNGIPLAAMNLAALPIDEAATTNYDQLFEDAAKAVGRPVAALPFESPADFDRWLVKLHGCVTEPATIKLARHDYLRRQDGDYALAGVVQAMLLTKHMLFVGFSLTDPTFHRIVHDVRAAVGDPADRPDPRPFGTALTLGVPGPLEELWEGSIDLVSLGEQGGGAGEDALLVAARRVELVLDALLDRCSSVTSFLLAPDFGGALTQDAQVDRDRLEPLLAMKLASPAARAALAEFVTSLGGDAPERIGE